MNESSNFKQAFWLSISQFCTFALSFVSAAILSRYFDKVEYGTYRQILYIYNTILVLFTGVLPSIYAYFIPRLQQREQKALIKCLNRLFLIIGAFFSIILFCLSDWIASILNNENLALGLKIFSIFPIFTLPSMGVEGLYTAIRRTKQIALYALISRLLMLLFIVAPVLVFKTDYKGAIIGWGVANFMIFILAMYMKDKPYINITLEFVPHMYKTIFNFALPLLGAFVAGFCINCADQFYISRFYGTSSFADFSNGWISIPFVSMISGSIKSVIMPVLSNAHSEGRLNEIVPVYNNAVRQSIIIVVPIICFISVFGAYLMTFLYGPKYISSAPYFLTYNLKDLINIVPYYSVLLAFGFSLFYLKVHIWGIALVWGLDAIIVFVLKMPPYYITLTQSLLQIVLIASSFIFIYKKTGIFFLNKNLIKIFTKILIHGIAIALGIYMLISPFASADESSLISLYVLILSCPLYIITMVITGRILKIDYLLLFKQKA